MVPWSTLYAANCVRSRWFAPLKFVCVFVRKLLIEFSSTDERTEDPLFQPDARKVPGIKGVSITILNKLVLMSFIAQALFNYCKS